MILPFNDLIAGDYFKYDHTPGVLYRKRTKSTAAIVGKPCKETGSHMGSVHSKYRS